MKVDSDPLFRMVRLAPMMKSWRLSPFGLMSVLPHPKFASQE